MPLEINEVGIRMRVRDAEDEPEQPKKKKLKKRTGCDDLEREELLNDAVRRVLDTLKNRKER